MNQTVMKITDLMIDEIILENFISYTNGRIKLADLTVIGGQKNGSGKTTIAQAIAYCLIGEPLSNIPLVDVVHHGSLGMMVMVTGKWDDKHIEIIRKFKPPNNKTLEINYIKGHTKESVSNPKELLDRIITESEFLNTIYINGHDINRFIENGNVARAKNLDRRFGIDDLRKILDCIKISAYNREEQETIALLSQKQTQITEIRRVISELSGKDGIIIDIKQTEDENTDIVHKLNEIKNEMIPLLELRKKEIIYQQTFQKITNSIKDQDVKINEATLDMENTLKKRIGLRYNDREILQLREKDAFYTRLIAQYNDQMRELIFTSRIKKTVIENKTEKCPICNHKITLNTKIELPEPKTLTDINTQLLQVQKDFDQNRIILDKLTKLEAEYNFLSDQISEKREYIITLKKEREQLVNDQTQLLQPVEHTEEKYNQILNKKHLYDAKLELNQKHIIQLKQKLEKMEKIQNTEPEFLTTLEIDIQTLKNDLQIIATKKKVLIDLRNAFTNALIGVSNDILKDLNPRIQYFIDLMIPTTANAIKPILYEIQLDETVKNNIASHVYTDYVRIYDVKTPFYALSTGQRAICGIAFSLAVTSLLQPMVSLLILDEIHTSGIDKTASDNLTEALFHLSKHLKVILIDRNDDLNREITELAEKKKIFVSRYEVENTDGKSTIIKIN